MAIRAPASSSSPYGPYSGYVDGACGADDVFVGLDAGERIGRPLAGRRRKALRRITVLGLVATAGWYAYDNPDTVRRLTADATAALVPLFAEATPRVAPAPAPGTAAPVQPTAEHAPRLVTALAEPEPQTAPAAAPAPTEPAAQPERLPPPEVDRADPLQKRALAAGLHPGLSRVLLAKLTATDYRNAETAIKTALAETPDSGVLIWPRPAVPNRALFQVRFVAGAPAECRRYVVAITLDNWQTTAQPLENCDLKPKKARRDAGHNRS